MKELTRKPNRLAGETSPYLLQHANNPVSWYPWGPEALKRALDEDKIILLSIGYSACHWCHVMERESFEDEYTAALMNQLFVNIKVDREERPDLDRIYQLAHQVLTRRPGGWPLTVFLTPKQHAPIFAGTYFPKQSRYGMPRFDDVLQRVADHYQENRGQMPGHAQVMRDALKQFEPQSLGDGVPSTKLLLQARDQLLKQFDVRFGGFGDAPKFPHPTYLSLLLRLAKEQPLKEKNLQVVEHTLQSMARGGLYDQLQGGFYRYSVDEAWVIPHFEKMLYDNAQLLSLYSDAATVTGQRYFSQIAQETADWVLSEMQSLEGGYFSTLDADSEDEEGCYYLWDESQLSSILSENELAAIKTLYGIKGTPNFEGRWHLNVAVSHLEAARLLKLPSEVLNTHLAAAHNKLRAERKARVRPHCDDKVLTSWNGLLLGAMARVGRRLDRTDLIDSAERALAFIQTHLWQEERLLATSRDGISHLNAHLDDYAFLAAGILELLQARWESRHLAFATELLDVLLDRFEDSETGGFFFTSNDHEPLLHRSRPLMDDAIPSGNGVAAKALIAYGYLIGKERYLVAAERLLTALGNSVASSPTGACTLLEAIDDWQTGLELVILRGVDNDHRHWANDAHRHYHPRRLVFAIDAGEMSLPGLLAERIPCGRTVAYCCKGAQCQAPILERSIFNTELALR